ncbi:small acid-soluble spore protein (thioredoxin-like protein) [Paenibacillus taihuensis]|uniref:Small acid-soluble spore protein (Thioredoxin-like protein) n=1 Tax=Paenibacillus taihuensis TaxID=1156355 RepID=A0A3D9QTI1_9BACL|nr:small acid-soluble spore protein Tlp [Paenibacillus taihuensis]REE66669.1 small acid-soluble spore protein (thioredoxin-like protein) [Paenibacillus taihuensis]
MSKPDNRADNAAHLQEHIENTESNLQETEAYLDEHASELGASEQQNLQAKNERRRQSLAGFEEELEDES